MIMNFVVVKHPKCATHYLFRVPEHVRFSPFIDVVCETRYGDIDGVTMTPSFDVPDEAVDRICDLYGTRKDDLKFVKSVFIRTDIPLDDQEKLDEFAEIFGRKEEETEEKSGECCPKFEKKKEKDDDTIKKIYQILGALADVLDEALGDIE